MLRLFLQRRLHLHARDKNLKQNTSEIIRLNLRPLNVRGIQRINHIYNILDRKHIIEPRHEKPAFFHTGKQRCSRAVDRCLCFRYKDSTSSLSTS